MRDSFLQLLLDEIKTSGFLFRCVKTADDFLHGIGTPINLEFFLCTSYRSVEDSMRNAFRVAIGNDDFD